MINCKFKKVTFVLFSLLILLTTACGTPGNEGQAQNGSEVQNELTVATQLDDREFGIAYMQGQSLNPIFSQNEQNLYLSRLLYDSLFTVNERFQAVPSLCESYSQDKNTYRFKLKQGVSFHGGGTLTASDVEYSLKLAKSEKSRYKLRLSLVLSIKQVGDYELEIKLNNENGAFPSLLDIPIIKKGDGDKDIPDGTGRYSLVYKENEPGALAATKNWFGGDKTVIKDIKLVPLERQSYMIMKFELGEIDIVPNEPLSPSATVFRGNYTMQLCNTARINYLGVNVTRKPYSDPIVRQALSEMIERQKICESELGGFAEPTYYPVNPAMGIYVQSGDYSGKPTDAANKLKAAGFMDKTEGRLLRSAEWKKL